MMFCGSLKKCELKKCGLCDKPCKRPLCKPLCPCIKKIEDVKEDLNTLKGDVDRNKQKIENNYNLLNDAISDLAEKHAHDHNYVLNYIDEKDAENDYLLEQEIIRAKAAELDIDDRLAKEIADRIEDVNNEETRATAAELTLDAKINQEIADRKADVDAEEDRAKQAENNLSDRLDKEIQDRIADVNAEESRAITAETNITNNLNLEIQNRINGDNILQQNINNLELKHNQDIQNMNDHLDDILGIDAQGVSEIKAILSDDDTTTGIITELAKKADKSSMTPGSYTKVTVNGQGIVTAGSNPDTIAGYGITDAYTKSEVDGKTSNLQNAINSEATRAGNAESALSLNKADKANMTPGTYTKVTVNNQGIVTSGSNPTTLADYGITDAKISNGTITLGGNSITPLTQHQNLSSYLTKTEASNTYQPKGNYLTQHQDISSKADSADVYTKTEVDDIINAIKRRLDILEGYWTLNGTTNRLETSYVIEPKGYR